MRFSLPLLLFLTLLLSPSVYGIGGNYAEELEAIEQLRLQQQGANVGIIQQTTNVESTPHQSYLPIQQPSLQFPTTQPMLSTSAIQQPSYTLSPDDTLLQAAVVRRMQAQNCPPLKFEQQVS